MSLMSVPSLAPTILLSTLRGPGIDPDFRNRLAPHQDTAALAPGDSARIGDTLGQARRGGSPA